MNDPAVPDGWPVRVQPLRLVIAIQALSYLMFGLWPLIRFSSFTSVAGPKPDRYQFFVTDLLVLAMIAIFISMSATSIMPASTMESF